MTRASAGRASLALGVAVLAWFALLLQCALSLELARRSGKSWGGGLASFFSYFTVLTNLSVALSLACTLAAPNSAPGRWCARPSAIAALATSIAFVGLAYHFLLRNAWNPQGAQRFADVLLHYAVPLGYAVYWWVESPRGTAPRWSDPAWWCLYPLVYCAYALLRGHVTASYPYAFIDAGRLGYARTLQNGVGLLLAFYALGLFLVAIDGGRRRLRA